MESELVRKQEREGGEEVEGIVGGCIDCFHWGIFAIKGCKQTSGSVLRLSPSRHVETLMHPYTFPRPAGKSVNTLTVPVECVD